MLRCAWCMKKIEGDKPVYGLSVKFKEGVEYNEKDGEIIQMYLKSRNTSVPIIITAIGSEAKKSGQDGIFALCSEKCGKKMREILNKEMNFSNVFPINLK